MSKLTEAQVVQIARDSIGYNARRGRATQKTLDPVRVYTQMVKGERKHRASIRYRNGDGKLKMLYVGQFDSASTAKRKAAKIEEALIQAGYTV